MHFVTKCRIQVLLQWRNLETFWKVVNCLCREQRLNLSLGWWNRICRADGCLKLSEDDVDDDNAHDNDADGEDRRENYVSRREIEIYRREKEIAERELELTRRELALLRECQNMDFANRERQEKVVVNNMRGQ